MNSICIIGAGFSGAVIAHELAEAGLRCDVFDSRLHVGGNCHTERDAQSGIMVHAYGPHIFHTNNVEVWNYIRRFDDFVPFTNRVKAVARDRVYSLPINLLTINQFFGKTLSPREAQIFLESLCEKSISDPQTFEEQALRFVGKDLYEAFLKGYTLKQWGVCPTQLPASILKRLPVRFNYDDNYYDSRYQGIPRNGYTSIVEKLLDHKNINLSLNLKLSRADTKGYQHTFYSGALDEWFAYSEGQLGYRTLRFELERHVGDYQGNPVINYCDQQVPWTRICEHKHFAPWEDHEATLIYKEFSRDCHIGDIPYYPLRLAHDRETLDQYLRLAGAEKAVSFVGRLGTYRYLDMHVTIEEALKLSRDFILNSSANLLTSGLFKGIS